MAPVTAEQKLWFAQGLLAAHEALMESHREVERQHKRSSGLFGWRRRKQLHVASDWLVHAGHAIMVKRSVVDGPGGHGGCGK